MKRWLRKNSGMLYLITCLTTLIVTYAWTISAFALENTEGEYSFKVYYTVKQAGIFNDGIAIYMKTDLSINDPDDPTIGYTLVSEHRNVNAIFTKEAYDAFIIEYESDLTWEEVSDWRIIITKTPTILFLNFANALIATKSIDAQGNYSVMSEGSTIMLPKSGVPTFFSTPE